MGQRGAVQTFTHDGYIHENHMDIKWNSWDSSGYSNDLIETMKKSSMKCDWLKNPSGNTLNGGLSLGNPCHRCCINEICSMAMLPDYNSIYQWSIYEHIGFKHVLTDFITTLKAGFCQTPTSFIAKPLLWKSMVVDRSDRSDRSEMIGIQHGDPPRKLVKTIGKLVAVCWVHLCHL